MVTHSDTGKLLKIIKNLTYVNVNAQIAKHGTMLRNSPKDPNVGLLRSLSESANLGNRIFDSEHELHNTFYEISRWVQKITLEYRDKLIDLGGKYSLSLNDAKKLEKDSNMWIKTIMAFYDMSIVKLLDEGTVWRVYDELTLMIDEESKDDLNEAIIALLSGLPTASVMLLNRVAEDKVKKFYVEVVGNTPPENYAWGDYERELKDQLGENDPIIGLLKFRRIGRNTSQHPGKKYESKDAEKILMKIQELIEEIESRHNQ